MLNKNESPNIITKELTDRTEQKGASWIRFLLLTAVLAGFTIYFIRHPDRLPDFKVLRWNYFVWVILLSVLANLAAALGYHAILKHCDPRLRRWQAVRIFIVGRALNLISPQGGTLYKAVSLKSGTGLSYTRYTAAVTANIWLDLTLASLTAALVLLLTPHASTSPFIAWGFTAAFICSVALIRIASSLSKRGLWTRLPFLPNRLRTKLSEVAGMVTELMGDRRLCLTFSSWALINTTIHGCRLWLCFAMIEQWIPWSQAFATMILVKASNTVAITPGNLGIVEGIVGFMGRQFGLTLGSAVVAGLAYRFASYIALLGMSAGFILWKPAPSKST